jgi:hypothetical protein
MKDQELLNQLNNLAQVKPSQAWLASNREILASQIYSGTPETSELSWAVKLNLFGSRILQPQYIAMMIVVFFVSSGVVGYQSSQDTKPGDTMYQAKRIGERAQLMMTFNDVSRAKLNLSLASERVEELKQVTVEIELNKSQAPEKLANAKESAKRQIAVARENVSRLKLVVPQKSRPAKATETKPSNPTDNKPVEILKPEDEYQSAGDNKSTDRIDISIPDGPNMVVSTTVETSDSIIDEAEAMLNDDNLDGAVEKLEEINKLIN